MHIKNASMKVQIITASALLVSAGAIANAGNPLDFSDEAVARGLDFDMGVNVSGWGSGMGLVDLDGDGDLDIMLGGATDFHIGVYENDGTGNFTDRTLTSGITNTVRSSGLSMADYDNDGDLDIFVNGWLSPSKLYRNNGDFTFTDVTAAAGVQISCPAMGTSWSDVDNDGYLDLYISVRTFTNIDPTRNLFFHNNGDGTFTDIAAKLGIESDDDPTLVCAFFDYDRDGDSDLYLGTDKGHLQSFWNRLFRNDGGTFTEVTAKTNSYAYIDCMGIAVGDINFDGFFDLYLTNIPIGNVLLMHDGVGAYTNQALAAGLINSRVGWGTVFADFDNDTELDLYVCNMMGENRLFRGSQDWPLVDEGPGAGVDEAEDVFCVSVGDVDGDNDLDMLVGNTNGKAHLYINNSIDAQINNWVRFNVVSNSEQHNAIGTCVDILSGGKTQLREIRSGVNYKSQDEFVLHYGLGNSTLVKAIDMQYPGGETRHLKDAPVNQTWTLYPQSRLGDQNGNGRIDYAELVAAIRARTAPGESIVPGQEIFDMDGDFDIDNDDIVAMGLATRSPTVFR